MSDWRKWIRIIVGLAIAGVIFAVFMNIVGDYKTAKQEQKRAGASKPATGPASSVTKTGRAPLTPPSTSTTKRSGTTSSGKGTTKTPVVTTGKVVLVLQSGVNMRAGPSTTDDVIRKLTRNERLAYLSTQDGYYEVRDKSGTTGWVTSKKVYTRLVLAQ